MNEEDLPESAREMLKVHRFNQEQYAKHLDKIQKGHMASVTRFIRFIDSLDNEQLDELQLIMIQCDESHSTTAEYCGIISGSRVYARGLMADGTTWEEALGLMDIPAEAPKVSDPIKTAEAFAEEVDEGDTGDAKDLQEALEREALLMQHDLQPRGSGETVVHKCGTPYASMEDAIETFIRKDGCPVCHQKEKWG